MATVLDVGLLRSFDVIFPVLLVFSIVFAILQKTKAVTDSLGINSIIAVSVAFMVLLSDTLVQIINFMVPWFTIAIIFLVLLLLLFQILGAGEKDIRSSISDKSVQWTIIGVGLVILVAAFGNVLGPKLTESSLQQGTSSVNVSGGGVATSNFESNVTATLFNPKVLGMIILFAIAIFAVALLTSG